MELCNRHRHLLEMLTAERNRYGRARKSLRQEITAHISWLEKRVRRLDRELDQAVRNSPLWREKEDLLRLVPGVGKVLWLNLLAHLPELGALSGLIIGQVVDQVLKSAPGQSLPKLCAVAITGIVQHRLVAPTPGSRPSSLRVDNTGQIRPPSDHQRSKKTGSFVEELVSARILKSGNAWRS